MRDKKDFTKKNSDFVLILILMEYALWVLLEPVDDLKFGLNPYSNGICSMRMATRGQTGACLLAVLILILMEYALWASISRKYLLVIKWVLILILMEYALWELVLVLAMLTLSLCLNPYSNGICSMSILLNVDENVPAYVLILILMEYALWVLKIYHLYSL